MTFVSTNLDYISLEHTQVIKIDNPTFIFYLPAVYLNEICNYAFTNYQIL